MKNILYTIILSFLFSSAYAICGDESKLYSGILNTDYDQFNRSERKEFALELLKRTKELDVQLPRLSPKEKEWLGGEIYSGNVERQFIARDSQEYAVHRVTKFFDETINILTDITNDKIKIKKEMVMWSNLAYTFLIYEYDLKKYFTRLVLDRVIKHPSYNEDLEKKYTPEKYKEHLEFSIPHNCKKNAIHIIRRILTRYIDGVDLEDEWGDLKNEEKKRRDGE